MKPIRNGEKVRKYLELRESFFFVFRAQIKFQLLNHQFNIQLRSSKFYTHTKQKISYDEENKSKILK